jgi:hypothetical protein
MRPPAVWTDSDQRYLDKLQGEINRLKAQLAEYDSIIKDATADPLISEVLREGRGRFLAEITTRRREWERYCLNVEWVARLEV